MISYSLTKGSDSIHKDAEMTAPSMNTQSLTITLNTGAKLPVVGLGVWQAPPGAAKEAVLRALEIGYRHVERSRSKPIVLSPTGAVSTTPPSPKSPPMWHARRDRAHGGAFGTTTFHRNRNALAYR